MGGYGRIDCEKAVYYLKVALNDDLRASCCFICMKIIIWIIKWQELCWKREMLVLSMIRYVIWIFIRFSLGVEENYQKAQKYGSFKMYNQVLRKGV